jgi:hypothetical protein
MTERHVRLTTFRTIKSYELADLSFDIDCHRYIIKAVDKANAKGENA